MTHTPGLFTRNTRLINFCLVVDDFGVKYGFKEHADHLDKPLQELYTITTDWEGGLYCGLTLTWDYINRTVDMSMPGYMDRTLTRNQRSPNTHCTPGHHQATAPPCN